MSKLSEYPEADKVFNILRRPPKDEIAREYEALFWKFYDDEELFQDWLKNLGWDNSDTFYSEMKTFEATKSLTKYL